jgi:hypothetical protein
MLGIFGIFTKSNIIFNLIQIIFVGIHKMLLIL